MSSISHNCNCPTVNLNLVKNEIASLNPRAKSVSAFISIFCHFIAANVCCVVFNNHYFIVDPEEGVMESPKTFD